MTRARGKTHQGRTVLYRLFDVAGTLLYIGITSDPKVRWVNHVDKKEWFPQVATTTFQWFDARSLAESAERQAIKDEKPLWNIRESEYRAVPAPDGGHVLALKPERKRQRGTNLHSFRYPTEKWSRFVELAEPNGSDVLQAFVDWYLGEPGAKAPKRPKPQTLVAVKEEAA